jgi:membrane-bound lytic murein transglycosylase B
MKKPAMAGFVGNLGASGSYAGAIGKSQQLPNIPKTWRIDLCPGFAFDQR